MRDGDKDRIRTRALNSLYVVMPILKPWIKAISKTNVKLEGKSKPDVYFTMKAISKI